MSDEKDIMEIDANNITRGQIETLLHRFLRNSKKDEGAEVIATAMHDYLNDMTCDGKELVKAVMNDHRTILQKKMNFIFRMVAAAAKAYKDGWFDLRNEDTFKLAAQIYDSLDDGQSGEDGRYHKLNLGGRYI